MALFDFLKKQKKQEKHEAKKSAPVKAVPDAVDEKSDDSTTQSVAVTERSVLIAPHVTERARMLAQMGQYTFRINPRASKQEVRDSVERMYGVRVTNVQMVKVHEKPRRRGLTEGVKKGYKKAVVALRSGEAIDIF